MTPESNKEEWTSHNFSFPLPAELTGKPFRDSQVTSATEMPKKKLPPSFSTSHIVHISGIRGRAYAENAEVSYRIIVEWSPLHRVQEVLVRDSSDEVRRLKWVNANSRSISTDYSLFV